MYSDYKINRVSFLIVICWCPCADLVIRWAKQLSPVDSSTVVAAATLENDGDETPAKKPKALSVRSRYLLKQTSCSTRNATTSKSVKSQMQTYLDYDHGEPKITGDGEIEEINSIKFWEQAKSDMPGLAKLAKVVLSIPASSAPVERVFSHGGLIFRPHWRSLADSNLSQLIFLKVNRLKLNLDNA